MITTRNTKKTVNCGFNIPFQLSFYSDDIEYLWGEGKWTDFGLSLSLAFREVRYSTTIDDLYTVTLYLGSYEEDVVFKTDQIALLGLVILANEKFPLFMIADTFGDMNA